MNLTRKNFNKFAPRARRSSSLYRALKDILPKYDITTVDREAAFLSQCHYESMGFRYMEENLNYSSRGLLQVFPRYFSGLNTSEYSRNPQKIANLVYANRMGNGDTSSGDGWRFRGRGFIQLTGKSNYLAFAKHLNGDLSDTIKYLETTEGAVVSACWYWDSKKLNRYADTRDIEKITYRINGGYHGLEGRILLYKEVRRLMEEDNSGISPLGGNINTTLQLGSSGKDVRDLQRALGITVDGQFGPNTRRAVEKFQKEIGVTRDGIADPYTLTKLYTGL